MMNGLKTPTIFLAKIILKNSLPEFAIFAPANDDFIKKLPIFIRNAVLIIICKAEITKQFFATVQNKLHWAITGQTAAEIIHSRADSQKQNMGLTTWKNAPNGQIRKTDVSIAKNYLNEKELDGLNRIVTMYLDYAEMQANNRKIMYMKDWVSKLDAFLQFNEKGYINQSGKSNRRNC